MVQLLLESRTTHTNEEKKPIKFIDKTDPTKQNKENRNCGLNHQARHGQTTSSRQYQLSAKVNNFFFSFCRFSYSTKIKILFMVESRTYKTSRYRNVAAICYS